MQLIEINNKIHIDKIKKIYYSSFPENERIDFQYLIDLKFPNSKLLGIFNECSLIGFSYISISGDYVYIAYLAIDEEFRNKNYGTTALNLICDLYNSKVKVLSVEKPYFPKDMPSRRIGFYKRNGFLIANFEFEWLGQTYYPMYNGKFDKQKFIDFLLVCFPESKDFKNIETEI